MQSGGNGRELCRHHAAIKIRPVELPRDPVAGLEAVRRERVEVAEHERGDLATLVVGALLETQG